MKLCEAAEFWQRLDLCRHGMTCKKCCWDMGTQGGTVFVEGVGIKASRLAFELAHGARLFPWRLGFVVCHRCDRGPMCCNPSHLFIGTPNDNMRDMLAKGRHGSKKNRGRPRVHIYAQGRKTRLWCFADQMPFHLLEAHLFQARGGVRRAA